MTDLHGLPMQVNEALNRLLNECHLVLDGDRPMNGTDLANAVDDMEQALSSAEPVANNHDYSVAVATEAGLVKITAETVGRFAQKLADKLIDAQNKYGYSDNWSRLESFWNEEFINNHLHRHLAKGDPRDVAIYCMFLYYHGFKTHPASERECVWTITERETDYTGATTGCNERSLVLMDDFDQSHCGWCGGKIKWADEQAALQSREE